MLGPFVGWIPPGKQSLRQKWVCRRFVSPLVVNTPGREGCSVGQREKLSCDVTPKRAQFMLWGLWDSNDPSELCCIRERRLGLHTHTSISHWMCHPREGGITLSQMALFIGRKLRLQPDSWETKSLVLMEVLCSTSQHTPPPPRNLCYLLPHTLYSLTLHCNCMTPVSAILEHKFINFSSLQPGPSTT